MKKTEQEKTESRKAFYEKFCKEFNTKTVYALSDTEVKERENKTSYVNDYDYIHIFSKSDTVHNLFYARFKSENVLYFVVENEIADDYLKLDDDLKDSIKINREHYKTRKFSHEIDLSKYKYIKKLDDTSKFSDNIIRYKVRVDTLVYCDRKNALKVARNIRSAYETYLKQKTEQKEI